MNRVRVALLVVFVLGGNLVRADSSESSTALKDDFQHLIGTWDKKTKDLKLHINFDGKAVQISISGLRGEQGFAGTGVGPLTEVKEDAQGRYFELDPFTSESSGLPRRIYYQLAGDTLVLDVSEGGVQGRHELTRD